MSAVLARYFIFIISVWVSRQSTSFFVNGPRARSCRPFPLHSQSGLSLISTNKNGRALLNICVSVCPYFNFSVTFPADVALITHSWHSFFDTPFSYTPQQFPRVSKSVIQLISLWPSGASLSIYLFFFHTSCVYRLDLPQFSDLCDQRNINSIHQWFSQ